MQNILMDNFGKTIRKGVDIEVDIPQWSDFVFGHEARQCNEAASL